MLNPGGAGDRQRLPAAAARPGRPGIARRGTPGPAAWILTVTAAVSALASTWSLTLLALTMLDDVPPLSALDDHPTQELPEPVPGPVALLAGLLLVCGAVRLAIDVHRRITTNRRLRGIGDDSQPAEHGMVVADWEKPMVLAVPGPVRGRGHLLVPPAFSGCWTPGNAGSCWHTSTPISPIGTTA